MEYLAGVGILATVWAISFYLRKDLRKEMLWSGWYYFWILTVGFVAITVIAPNIPQHMSIIPGYWNPNTLFDLGRLTGGYSIEDALYMFFTGGIAASIYEMLFRKHIGRPFAKHRPHLALAVGVGAGILTVLLFDVNLIYMLIAFGFAGACTIWIQRPDLLKHSVFGGITYLLIYLLFFSLFLLLYPHFVETYYSLENLSGILFLGIPLEELLFALSFGLLWSPIYEYVRDVR